MKITLIGGGSVKSTQFISALLRRADFPAVDEFCLMDIDSHKLEVMGTLCGAIVETAWRPIRVTTTTDPHVAFSGADYVITTIRVGGDDARVLDERIALEHRVLGQETTGPGGFAMAMRSIPAILEYAKILRQENPNAWMFNFTNPSGLVTQALYDQGFDRVIGICDSANNAQNALAAYCGVPADRLRAELFGLNHLSWTRKVKFDGMDELPRFLQDDRAVAASTMGMFEPSLVHQLGMYLNEYLFYYYYSERALASILKAAKTRGEEVREISERLWKQLDESDPQTNPRAALDLIASATRRREATYMHYSKANSPSLEQADRDLAAGRYATPVEGDGYAGVVLDIIQAMESGRTLSTGLNVPNRGAIACMRDDDIVEVSCEVDQNGVRSLLIGEIPEHQELLMRSVKRYERLAVEAILNRSRETAAAALMSHPLVMSYSLGHVLIDEYLLAHRRYVGDWA